jgi:hypothetical protein
MENNHNKYVFYIVIKFAAYVFLQNYQLSKERAEALSKKEIPDKQSKEGNIRLFQ